MVLSFTPDADATLQLEAGPYDASNRIGVVPSAGDICLIQVRETSSCTPKTLAHLQPVDGRSNNHRSSMVPPAGDICFNQSVQAWSQTTDRPWLLIWRSRRDSTSLRLWDDQAVLPALQVFPGYPTLCCVP